MKHKNGCIAAPCGKKMRIRSVRLNAAEDAAFETLKADLGLGDSDVLRQALSVLAGALPGENGTKAVRPA